MNFETLTFQQDNEIGILTLNRPKALNALNGLVLKELATFLENIQQISGLKALVITGGGEKAFVAGADIKEMENIETSQAKSFAQNGQSIFQKIEELSVPTIAAVNGFALGGGLELAMACDFIVASSDAKLGLPEVSLGLIPGYGGTQRLARYCGKAVARLMVFTGDMYTSEQCASWGLVSLVTTKEELMPTCQKLAKKMAQRSPKAIRLAKTAILEGFDLPQKLGMEKEAQLFQEAFASADKVEGVKAFVEKRQPQFLGK